MSVRVLRVIEITYPDHEAYEANRLNWGLPANGERRIGGATYRSSTMLSETIGDSE